MSSHTPAYLHWSGREVPICSCGMLGSPPCKYEVLEIAVGTVGAELESLRAQISVLAREVRTEEGVFTFEDGSVIGTPVGVPVEVLEGRVRKALNELKGESRAQAWRRRTRCTG